MSKQTELELGGGAKLLSRADIPNEYKWHLDDIYKNQEEWEVDFTYLKEHITDIDAFRGKLAKSSRQLKAFFTLRDELSLILEKLYVYANMKSHEDTAVAEYQAICGRVASLSVEFSTAVSFAAPELLAAGKEKLEKFAQSPILKDYKFALRELIRNSEHILSEAEEAIISRAGDMAQVADNAFSMLTNADMQFPSIKDEHDKTVEMSEERAVGYLRSSKMAVRQAAFKSLYTPYNDYKNTLGATFDGMLKTAKFEAECRRYSSPLAMALHSDNIPEAVYANLIDTVEANLEPMYRYMELRKRLLRVKQLHAYDLYVPLTRCHYGPVVFEDAKALMFTHLAPLGDKYLEQVQNGINEGWIDVFTNRGKRSGAYSWGSYNTHPYIFMNYTNRLEDAFTLVHEMGHSMHSWYSHKNQPYPTSNYSIFTAEVASTTNEVLLLSGLLASTEERKKRIFLLNRRLENIRTTVYRQTMFAAFEREVHRRAAAGEDTTAEALKVLWYDLNRKYYGDTLVIDEPLKMEWARIPHFYTPFYVYQYATGFSAATALAGLILEKGAPARDKYLNFLTKGGSDYPINLLADAGVDMSTPAPVSAVMKQFDMTVKELDELTR